MSKKYLIEVDIDSNINTMICNKSSVISNADAGLSAIGSLSNILVTSRIDEWAMLIAPRKNKAILETPFPLNQFVETLYVEPDVQSFGYIDFSLRFKPYPSLMNNFDKLKTWYYNSTTNGYPIFTDGRKMRSNDRIAIHGNYKHNELDCMSQFVLITKNDTQSCKDDIHIEVNSFEKIKKIIDTAYTDIEYSSYKKYFNDKFMVIPVKSFYDTDLLDLNKNLSLEDFKNDSSGRQS